MLCVDVSDPYVRDRRSRRSCHHPFRQQRSAPPINKANPHIVVLGGGFAGLNMAKDLGDIHAQITLIDRQNHHLFQPLLYQVATATLSAVEIAKPLRSILSMRTNVTTEMAEVQSVDLATPAPSSWPTGRSPMITSSSRSAA